MNANNFQRIGIAGAGIMGASIAQCFANAGYSVVIYDLKDEFLNRGRTAIKQNQSSLIAEGLLTQQQADDAAKKITYTTQIDDLSDASLVIEAIIEKLDIKQQFWQKLSRIVSPDAILATNTSGLSVTAIGQNVLYQGRFAGMHWWNPPHIVPLVEVIMAKYTSEDTANSLMEISKQLGKIPILVKKDAHGFVGNRLQFAVFREALNIVEQGIATVEDVDKALKFGPGLRYSVLGALETADLGGLDTFYYISSYLFADLSQASKPPEFLKKLVDENNFGVKTGKGFYDYADGKDVEVIRRRDVMFLQLLKMLTQQGILPSK
ncbi:3-hydroxybutyryl-CoA dehydrogenase [Sporomusa carbonis]|uniref:3-hydroxyacyl-CoA dehydrogenase family protein n=1 Tax=Sporomusa carbonis TaxID=3076075 RepID=UPI003A5E8900